MKTVIWHIWIRITMVRTSVGYNSIITHGTIAKKTRTVQDIIIGEKEDDPVLVFASSDPSVTAKRLRKGGRGSLKEKD